MTKFMILAKLCILVIQLAILICQTTTNKIKYSYWLWVCLLLFTY